MHPTSRGYLSINSSDPTEPPQIHPNYLSSELDKQEMLEGSKLLRKLASAPALADIIDTEIVPGADVQTDADLLSDTKERAGTVFHPVGTCQMGPDPKSAVVDACLRVHGVGGLRVVDASIFPTLTSGNTNAPAIMVGEKGADMILSSHAGSS